MVEMAIDAVELRVDVVADRRRDVEMMSSDVQIHRALLCCNDGANAPGTRAACNAVRRNAARHSHRERDGQKTVENSGSRRSRLEAVRDDGPPTIAAYRETRRDTSATPRRRKRVKAPCACS